jgi:predicted DNA-binding protein (MmcQ/YjbR family)
MSLDGHVVLARARAACAGLPEASEESTAVGAQWRVRRRVFAQFVTITDPGGADFWFLACHADPVERDVLGSIGHPYFIPRSGRDRIGVILDTSTDWEEIAELVRESYRVVAPKKLVALLDAPAAALGDSDR